MPTIEELRREALRLDPSNRAALARGLLVSPDGLPTEEVERLWIEEAEGRLLEMQSGEVMSIPIDEVFERARACRT